MTLAQRQPSPSGTPLKITNEAISRGRDIPLSSLEEQADEDLGLVKHLAYLVQGRAPSPAGNTLPIAQTQRLATAKITLPMMKSANVDLGDAVPRDPQSVHAFLSEHVYYDVLRKILALINEHIQDVTKLELSVIAGDFEGETYLEVMVHSEMEPDSFVNALREVHEASEKAIPLERLILTSINFRLH